MKKYIFVLVAVFTVSFVSAQDISFGVKAGLNLATLHSSSSEFNDAMDSRIAFHVGGVIDISFSDKLSVQPELLYNSVGSGVDFGGDDGDFIIDYFSIPVMVKYYAVEGLSLELGPQVGFLLSAKAKAGDDDEDFKDQMKSTDFGLGLGAGYKLENGLFFDARYVLGLSNTWKDTDDEWIKNNTFQFSVGFMFN